MSNIDEKARFADARRMIQEGRYADACGTLRLLLELYLKKLCKEKGVKIPNNKINDMIDALDKKGVIDKTEKTQFRLWQKFGNAGNHVSPSKIKKLDAEYFFESLRRYFENDDPMMTSSLPTVSSFDTALAEIVATFLMKSAAREDYSSGGRWRGRYVSCGVGERDIHYLTCLASGVKMRTGRYPAVYVYTVFGKVFSAYGLGTESGGYPSRSLMENRPTIQSHFQESIPEALIRLQSDPSTRRYNYLDNRFLKVYELGGDQIELANRLAADLQTIVADMEGWE